MSGGYPITGGGPLEPAPRRGFLGLGRRYRDGGEVPKADAHQVLVYRVDGDYLVDRGRLGPSDEQVVNATHVSVVDMRRSAQVVVELPIPSRDASVFTMRVTFACTVTDPLVVVREGINAASVLAAYLKSHRRIFELGLDYAVGDINDVRRDVNAQVMAYVTVKPPAIPGLGVLMASVEVLTPQELIKLEENSRAQRHSHRLENEQRQLQHRPETGGERESQELADLRASYQRDTEYEQPRHDQLASTERQRHDQFLEAERSEFRRRELNMALEMLGDDPRAALERAYYAGQLDAYLAGRSDQERFGDQFRADRDQERALEAAQEERHEQRELEAAREEREDRRQAAQWKRGKRLKEIEADREDRRLAHGGEQRRSDQERDERLQRLLWEREDMLRRESDQRDDRKRRLEINLEVLKILASRGHVDMVNLDVDRLVDELAPPARAEILAGTPVAETPGEAASPLSAAPDDDADTELLDAGDGGDGNSTSKPRGQTERPERFFLAELEDRPTLPLKRAEQYTIAFSVGLSSAGAIGAEPFPDEILSAAAEGVDLFDLTVQLDSEDFEIFGERTRPLRVPRSGRPLGKARFDIAPRRNGRCRLVASVHYRGNFVQQMELAVPVGSRREARVEVLTRGRPPDSAAGLEPRNISIVLEPAPTGGFSCTALGSVVGRTTLPIKDSELAAAVESARAAMMRVIQSVYAGELIFQAGIDIPDEAADSALRTLARAGSRLFQQLFLHPAAGADARRIGEWLRGYALDPGLRLTVQIVADRAPLPWAMLYLGDASEGAELGWYNFLGMRHVVEQLPLQSSLGTRDNEILSEPSLAVSVNVNTSIDASMGITLVAEHQKYWADAATARAGLKLVSRSTKSEVLRALADGGTGDQVVYFYCHATTGGQDNRGLDAAAIIMGKNDSATLADLYIDAPTNVQLAGNPLVFINACESAELSPLFYDGFVPYFMAKGARGVVGTECRIPVLFAIEWADAFFEEFLDGATVGEAMLKLRQDFVRLHNNPLGLIYAIHCDADTRIAPALVRAKAQ